MITKNNLQKTVPSLQIQTYGQMVKLTKGQKGLLDVITKRVLSKETLTWDDIVDTYCNCIRKTYTGGYYSERTRTYAYTDKNIKEEYKNYSYCWSGTLRPLIKGWFLTSIGTLVIKNQLAVIPLIEVE